jgi:feruloyl esterase
VGSVLSMFAATFVVAPDAQGQAVGKCAEMAKLQVPGMNLVITKAEQIAAGPAPASALPGPAITSPFPAYCRVDGTLDPRTGAAGKPYGIGFAIALPEPWNGRFLFQGGGGLNGSVLPPFGQQAAGGSPALAKGFAVVSTDTGHKGTGVFDGSFYDDQQASLDFAYAANARVTVLSRQIIAAYYGRSPDRSYFAGCSTGGREGMVMAQRNPMMFDGIVSGAPAMRTGFSVIGTRAVAIALNQAAPKDASGKPNPSALFSDSDKQLIIDGILNACDAKDGVKDRMIFNTQACDFDPLALVCRGPKAEGCLTTQQAAAVKKAFTAVTDSRGSQVYARFLYDTGIAARSGFFRGLLSPAPGGGPFPPNLATEQDVDKEVAAALANPQAVLTDSASWTNLSSFSGHGGKWLFYHGVSDPVFSAQDTVEYYEKMIKANGGAAAQGWSRLFLVPGMAHCGGGELALDSFDLLAAVVDWVEKGVAPDSVIATGKAFPGRSRPLCAYPTHAHYKGQGDTEDARNFECRGVM